MNHESITKAAMYALKILPEIHKYEKHALAGSMMNFRLNVASLFFQYGQKNECKKQLQSILDSKGGVRIDLIGATKILDILVNFDLHASEYTESLNMSARRFFRKNPELNSFDGAVFRLVDRILNNAEEKHAEIYQDALQTLYPILEKDSNALALEEVVLWIESRLQKKPILNVWEERHDLRNR
jgi:hypothetical protein